MRVRESEREPLFKESRRRPFYYSVLFRSRRRSLFEEDVVVVFFLLELRRELRIMKIGIYDRKGGEGKDGMELKGNSGDEVYIGLSEKSRS